MEQKVDMTNNVQKAFALLLLGGVLVLLYWLLPPLVVILKNLWLAVVLAVPLIFLIFNYTLVWSLFKIISWNLTKRLISVDKLGFLDNHLRLTAEKKEKVVESRNSLAAAKMSIDRTLQTTQNRIEEHMKQAIAIEARGIPSEMASLESLAYKIKTDSDVVKNLQERSKTADENVKQMTELVNVITSQYEKIAFTIKVKSEEYETLKLMAKASNTAKQFLNGDSEASRIYNESLKQIEKSVCDFSTTISSLESDIQPLVTEMHISRAGDTASGISIIEEYKKTLKGFDFNVVQNQQSPSKS